MGASASISRIPRRSQFDLDTVQDVVGEDEWKPEYEKQFHSVAGDRGALSYDQFAALYQRNLLAQTSPRGLLEQLLTKFRKILTGEGSEEAAAFLRAERDRRIRDVLAVPWLCPTCGVPDQAGAQCGICAADNPKLAAIHAEESSLEAEPPITDREVATVEVLLEKVRALEESVLSMATFLKSISRGAVAAGGGSRALRSPDGLALKLRLLRAQSDSVRHAELERRLLAEDVRRYDETLAVLRDPTNVVAVAPAPEAQACLQRKVARVQAERAAAAEAAEALGAEHAAAVARYEATLRRTREEVLPSLLGSLLANAKAQDALLVGSFADVVELEATARKLQQRAVDCKWLDPFRPRAADSDGDCEGDGEGGGSGGAATSPPPARRRRRASLSGKNKRGTSGGGGAARGSAPDFPFCVRQSVPQPAAAATDAIGGSGGGGGGGGGELHDEAAAALPDDVADTTTLSFLFHVYRAAAAVDASVLGNGLKRWAAAAPGGRPRPCPLKPLERALEKANTKYAGDFSRLLDVARGSVSFPSVAGVRACLEAVYDDSSVQVLRVKARLGRGYEPVAAGRRGVATGYRDVLLNLRAAPHCGVGDHIFELQLHLDSFLANQPNGGARIMRLARELHVVRYPLLQLDPPRISPQDLEPLTGGFARTLDLQGVRFTAPREDTDEDTEPGPAVAAAAAAGAAAAGGPNESMEHDGGDGGGAPDGRAASPKLVDTLVESFCAASVSQLNVLRLSATNITGPMVQQLCTAAAESGAGARLTHLDLAYTTVPVDVIPAVQKAFPALKGLAMNSCALLGEVPACVGELKNLESLELQCNQLGGRIPESVTALRCLVRMPLYGNRLSGPIPVGVCELERLTSLQLFDNQLTGRIPEQIGALAQLQTLDLHSNSLTGPLPTSLGQLRRLTALVLHRNQLTGRVPTELAQLLSLQKLWLDDNALTGKLPLQVGYLRHLESLQARNNKLVGPVPPSLGALARLESLDLSWNCLTGPIPKTLAKCTALVSLVLDGNQLTSSIPAALGGLKRLASLHLYGNQLTGRVPPELRRLAQLAQLSLFKNPHLAAPEGCPVDAEGHMNYKSREAVEAFMVSL